MNPINAQTPGPLSVCLSVLRDEQGNEIAHCSPYGAGIVPPGYVAPWHRHAENARLLAASYTAFDHAGRELGIDAATLAERIDLAEVLRYALDYAQLHGSAHTAANVGRPDQVQAARRTLAPVADLMDVDI